MFIIFIYLELLIYIKLYLKILIINYISKTNKYKIPLFNKISINTN
jgi:hypothetical protein